MKAIGGYFGLELRCGKHYHENAIRLNTARNCLEYIFRARNYQKVYIPYYTCEVVLEPLKKLNIKYEFYSIDEKFEPLKEYTLKVGEAFLYTNYFGLKQDCVKKLTQLYGSQLIVDNAQAFYAPRIEGIDTFYSPRKYFGVADGGYLYTDKLLDGDIEQDISFERMSHLLKRVDLSAEMGYNDFVNNDRALDYSPIKKMSNLSKSILASIDYDLIKSKRLENFRFLDSKLKENNQIEIHLDNESVPMIYPFMVEGGDDIKKTLIKNKVFVATYWPNVLKWCSETVFEYNVAKNLISLPIDQRYNLTDMDTIIGIIKREINK